MLVWATAAFINRRSRMAEVIAAVPTAAQAAWRINWRREISAGSVVLFIALILDREIRGSDEQVNDGADAVAHLLVRGCRVLEVGVVADVIDDVGLDVGRQLAAHQD